MSERNTLDEYNIINAHFCLKKYLKDLKLHFSLSNKQTEKILKKEIQDMKTKNYFFVPSSLSRISHGESFLAPLLKFFE